MTDDRTSAIAQEAQLQQFLAGIQALMETRDAEAMMLFATIDPLDANGKTVPNAAVFNMDPRRLLAFVHLALTDLASMTPAGELQRRLGILANASGDLLNSTTPKPKIITVMQ